MSLAIFDLDNTLIAGDSDHSWGEFIVEQGLVDVEHYRAENDRFYREYENGGLDVNEYLRFALEPLTRYSLDELAKLHQQFMAEKIDPMRLPKAEALLQKHRDAGDYLLIMTSTNSFVTGPIAASLGVDEIMASEAEIIDGRYTGNVVGTPCFQAGKVTRLQQWLAQYDGDKENCYFYSDSINDLPLLSEVDNPVAVDPDDTLRAHAEAAGWPVISLRD
ncbi:HAD family hydrolase [Maricurvus nonylphenolicus]|uniref:histidinol-phosphatase n=1 Tax=Maricurvus nonylphenolicus TaxID=1008307 RepID=UPI0036F1A1C0